MRAWEGRWRTNDAFGWFRFGLAERRLRPASFEQVLFLIFERELQLNGREGALTTGTTRPVAMPVRHPLLRPAWEGARRHRMCVVAQLGSWGAVVGGTFPVDENPGLAASTGWLMRPTTALGHVNTRLASGRHRHLTKVLLRPAVCHDVDASSGRRALLLRRW